jgi:anthranilate phosphoribosyltransferase
MSEFENLKMKKILQLLFEHKSLDRQQAKEVLLNIGKAMYNEH